MEGRPPRWPSDPMQTGCCTSEVTGVMYGTGHWCSRMEQVMPFLGAKGAGGRRWH